MESVDIQNRLSRISTVWTLLHTAKTGKGDALSAAQRVLVERYKTAVYSYLLGAVRDPDTADELFQEFALRLVRGDFGRADPARGRFRDYLKTALINLVINHNKKLQRLPATGIECAEPASEEEVLLDSDAKFLADWRKAILDRAWEALTTKQNPDGPPFLETLRLQSEIPGLTGSELAERLNAGLTAEKQLTEVAIRKILQRARERFADALIDEVAHSLQANSLDELERELIDLGFYPYCRRAMERRRSGQSS